MPITGGTQSRLGQIKEVQISLTPSAPGNFQVAHGLGFVPAWASAVRMTSPGQIWFQSPTPYDATYLYLVASDSGLTGDVQVFR